MLLPRVARSPVPCHFEAARGHEGRPSRWRLRGRCGGVCECKRGWRVRTDARNVGLCVRPLWLKPRSGSGCCERRRVHVQTQTGTREGKTAGNCLFSTIRAFEYRGNHSYERGRDAKGGEGVKSEVGRRGSDCRGSEPRYEMGTCGGEAAGYTGPRRGGDAGGKGARWRD